MPLQIRRGSTAQRLAITPLIGELIYDTTTGQLFVGNGTTLGGATTTGISTEDAQDAAASLFSTGSHSGITFAYNDAAGRIDATVTVAATGPFDGDLTGSVFADNSSLLVDGVDALIVGNVESPSVTFTTFFGTPIDQITNASLIMRGTAIFYKDNYDAADTTFFNIQQHHSTADANPINFIRTRGTNAAPAAVQNGDDIIDIVFNGHDGTTFRTAASITVGVEGAVSSGVIPGAITFRVRQGASINNVARIANTGAFESNLIGALSGTTINVVDNNTITLGDVRLSQDGLSTINTNASLILSANGTGSVDIESVRIRGNAISVTDSTILNIESLQISGSTISTTDSSGITVSQASTFSSNLTVDGTLTVGDSIVQNNPNRDYVSTTLQTQGVARVVEGVQNGIYTQLVSSTAETYTTITYNATTFKGCRATIKASYGATNVFIGEVLLANTTTAVTIVNAQATAATIGTSPISSVTADYDSATASIRLRPVTAASLPAAANYNWTVSYQLFT
jgi:hypothetical protein